MSRTWSDDEDVIGQRHPRPVDFGLFAAPRPVTSMQAQEKAKVRAGSRRETILFELRAFGAMTRKQLSENTCIPKDSVNSAVNALCKAALAHEAGTLGGEKLVHHGPTPTP